MDNRLLFLLSRAEFSLKKYLKGKFREKNISITPGQMGILFLLKSRDAISMSELGTALYIDNSTITRLVDRLESKGLVKRLMNPDDRRQYLLSITEKGTETINSAKNIVQSTNDLIKKDFSKEEIDAFKRVLESFTIKFQ
ncbi:MAG TPA: MarR family transcriptional regulator [Spirochaetota bacterium]|nr:MarR family transcriptional regulator [Spirochaetota bacterium]HQO03663.1 MarR family transcriptional regulator [Spirochaetota bacterium]